MNEERTKHKEQSQRLPSGPVSTWGSQRRIPREELYKIPAEFGKEIFNSISYQ